MHEVKGRRPGAVKPNVIDRVVGFFNPVAGVRRVAARATLARAKGYRGADKSRRPTRNWHASTGSVNAEVIGELDMLRARSRDLSRNMPLATGAVSTKVANIVGAGLQLKPSVDRETLGLDESGALALHRQILSEWKLFCKQFNFDGQSCFADDQGLVQRGILESGDVLLVRRFEKRSGDRYGLKFVLIEADRVANPNNKPDTADCIAGVKLDADKRAVGYHFCDEHPGDLLRAGSGKWHYVPRMGSDNRPLAKLLFRRLRPDQARGIPYLAPVIEALHQLGDYIDAEVTAAVNSAMIFAFETSPSPVDDGGSPLLGEQTAANDDDEVTLENGAYVSLAPGSEIEINKPGRPNSEFENFTVAFLRMIGVAFDLPFELLVKHFTASYSASRAALEMAWQHFRVERAWFAREFCDWVYELFMFEAVARGYVTAPGFLESPVLRTAYLGSEWIGPARIQLDPVKESKADANDVAEGFKTIDQVIVERTGGDFDRKHEQRVREFNRRKEDGLEKGHGNVET